MSTPLPLTEFISQTSSASVEFRTLKIQFGNGYSQRTPDGINDKGTTWSLTYTPLTLTNRNTLWTFLNTVKGSGVITWTPPGGVSSKFVLEGRVSERVLAGDVYSLSFSIKQVFDLG